jgi:hypothetical protein
MRQQQQQSRAVTKSSEDCTRLRVKSSNELGRQCGRQYTRCHTGPFRRRAQKQQSTSCPGAASPSRWLLPRPAAAWPWPPKQPKQRQRQRRLRRPSRLRSASADAPPSQPAGRMKFMIRNHCDTSCRRT